MAIPVPPEPGAQAPARPGQAITIAQLIINGLGMVFSLLIAGLMVVVGLIDVFGRSGQSNGATAVFAIAWIALLVALLSAPSLFFAIMRLANREVRLPNIPTFLLASSLLLLWPLALAVGGLTVGNPALAWLILPPVQILAVGIPILWLVEFARRKISTGSPQRTWSILSFSMLITTPLVIIVETLLLILIAVIAMAWISSQPALLNELQRIANQLQSGQMNPQEFMNLARPYLQNPLTLIGALALISGIIPMLEELLKPLAIWLLAGRKLTPAQGFAAGAICGGSFALLESLFTISGAIDQGWPGLVIARSGTALLHITTASLVGSALAAAWQNRSYLRLVRTYLAACVLHGLWNALSIFTSLGALLEKPAANLRFLIGLSFLAPFLLGVLVLFLFLLLWNTNRLIRQESEPALMRYKPVLMTDAALLPEIETVQVPDPILPPDNLVQSTEHTEEPPTGQSQSL